MSELKQLVNEQTIVDRGSGFADVIDRIDDADWKTANAMAYRIGIGNGLERVIYRLIQAEKKVSRLEEEMAWMRGTIFERLSKLEVQIKNGVRK